MIRRDVSTTLFLIFNAVVGVFTLLAGDKLFAFLPQVGIVESVGTAWMVCVAASVIFSFALLFWMLLPKPRVEPVAPVPSIVKEVTQRQGVEDVGKHKDSFEWKMQEAARHVPTPQPVQRSEPQRRVLEMIDARKSVPPVSPPVLESRTNPNYDALRAQRELASPITEIPVEVEQPSMPTYEELRQIQLEEDGKSAPPSEPRQAYKSLDYGEDDNPYR